MPQRLKPFRILALAALIASAAAANDAQAASSNIPDYEAVETNVGAVTLPAGAVGPLIVIPCAGCQPRTFQAIASTLYLLGEQTVKFAEFRAATLGRPKAFVTVIYDLKTNELYSISASVDPASVTPPANAARNRQPAR